MTVRDTDSMPQHTDDPLVVAGQLAESAVHEELGGYDTGPNAATPLIDVLVSIPAATALQLKHATSGRLDIAAAASLVLQLYSAAPLDRSAVTLTSDEHARICSALGFSPQTTTELVAGIEELVRISFGGVRIKLTADEVAVMNARNATGMSAREFAEQELRRMFEAWRNGVI